jgi:hypothetical protein
MDVSFCFLCMLVVLRRADVCDRAQGTSWYVFVKREKGYVIVGKALELH